MISSAHSSCKQLVAGNYDVLINESPMTSASFKSVLTDYLDLFERQEADLGEYHKKLQLASAIQPQQQQQNGGTVPQIDATCGYIEEFKMLKELSKSLKKDKSNFLEGEFEQNKRKNRYKDILPFSHTRVILGRNRHPCKGDSKVSDRSYNGSDDETDQTGYINANYIRGPSGSPRAYIACQGPLACTLNDFWRMIWECNVSVIVMACNENESGRPKCELYWPDQLEASQTYGDVQVTLVRVRQINSEFLIRKLSVKLLEPLASPSPQPPQPLPPPPIQSYNPMADGNNNASNQMTTEDTYDCDSNSFKLAGVRLPTALNAPFHRLHGSGRNQFANVARANNNSSIRSNGYCLSNGNSSTSNESISTSDDSSTATLSRDHNHYQAHNQHQHQQTNGFARQCQQQPATAQHSNRQVLAERTICQFHYTTWPDHGVPDSVQPILELVRLIREVQPAENKPVLIHCSAGCGRTGTICCIDYVWGLLRLGKLEANFNLCKIISEMRQQRMAMVQTLEQYILCHRAVAALFVQQLQLLALDSHRRISCSPATTPSTNNEHSSSSIEDRINHEDDKEEEEEDDDDDDDEIINYNDNDDVDENDLGPVFI